MLKSISRPNIAAPGEAFNTVWYVEQIAHAALSMNVSMSAGSTESTMSNSEVRIMVPMTWWTRSQMAFACGFFTVVGVRFMPYVRGYTLSLLLAIQLDICLAGLLPKGDTLPPGRCSRRPVATLLWCKPRQSKRPSSIHFVQSRNCDILLSSLLIESHNVSKCSLNSDLLSYIKYQHLGYLHNQNLLTNRLIWSDDLLEISSSVIPSFPLAFLVINQMINGSSTTSDQLEAGAIMVRAMKSID